MKSTTLFCRYPPKKYGRPCKSKSYESPQQQQPQLEWSLIFVPPNEDLMNSRDAQISQAAPFWHKAMNHTSQKLSRTWPTVDNQFSKICYTVTPYQTYVFVMIYNNYISSATTPHGPLVWTRRSSIIWHLWPNAENRTQRLTSFCEVSRYRNKVRCINSNHLANRSSGPNRCHFQ